MELGIPGKFKTTLNKEAAEIEALHGNTLNHLLLNKFLQPFFIVIYDFETTIVETNNQSKFEKSKTKIKMYCLL